MPYDRGMSLIRIVLPATPLAVRETLSRLFDPPDGVDLPEALHSKAQIVLAEVLNNIVEHAYATYAGDIDLCCEFDDKGLNVLITDRGLPLPLSGLPAGNDPMEDPGDDLPEGGFGWFLIRTLAEDLNYDRTEGSNRLRFRVVPDTIA